MTPQIKVCGVTDPSFAAAAAARGVDFIGVIFAASSPRRVSAARAREIAVAARAAARGSACLRVAGVFAGQSAGEIEKIAAEVPLDVVQLHGMYGESEVRRLAGGDVEIWRLLCGGRPPDAASFAAGAVLLDGWRGSMAGGTGRLADWSLVSGLKRGGWRVVLAGGLKPDNAAAAAATGADVLDVNSGIETAPGVKSLAMLEDFLRAVRGV